jgi:hypothetical protein
MTENKPMTVTVEDQLYGALKEIYEAIDHHANPQLKDDEFIFVDVAFRYHGYVQKKIRAALTAYQVRKQLLDEYEELSSIQNQENQTVWSAAQEKRQLRIEYLEKILYGDHETITSKKFQELIDTHIPVSGDTDKPMTVGELREKIKDLPGDMLLQIENSDYPDYLNCTQIEVKEILYDPEFIEHEEEIRFKALCFDYR